MVARDSKVIYLDTVVRQAADRGGGLCERDLFQHLVILLKFQIEFCHCCPPENSLLKILWYQGLLTTRTSRHVMLSSPPRSLAIFTSSPHACSRPPGPSTIFKISSSCTYRVSPSDAINRMSPGTATRSSTSASTASSEPSARRMMFCISDFCACSSVM